MNEIAAAFVAACRDEIEAPKPGNVHVYADGHGMIVDDFLRSAEAAAPALCAGGTTVGDRLLSAVEATFSAVGLNTNLGILLLCAPLASAVELGGDLRSAVRRSLDGLTRADAEKAFRAILRAQPAGLGNAPRHDVRSPAEATLLEAMREAAGRDRIAFQYASGFHDIFETGFEALGDLRGKGWRAPWLAVGVHLAFLSRFSDSHISRKHGPDAAAVVQDEARRLHRAFVESSDPAELFSTLLRFDRELKARGMNPGTTADLTVATLFADRLTHSLIARHNDG